MIPIVNDKHKYILFYNPKSACSFIRRLFMELHQDEFTQAQLQKMESWHNLNRIMPFDTSKNYSDYYKFTLVRHPYTRFISSYLNRVVIKKENHEELENFLRNKYSADYPLTLSFNQFLDCFVNSPLDYLSNVHFYPQSKLLGMVGHYRISTAYGGDQWSWSMLRTLFDKSLHLQIDKVCKMETLGEDVLQAYQQIFADNDQKLEQVITLLNNSEMYNVSYSDQNTFDDACDLSCEALRSMGKTPSYENFLTADVQQQLHNKFESDFQLFNYDTDLQSVLDFERDKNQQIQKLVPDDFNAQQYLAKNPDLAVNGINSSADALLHWIHHGREEDRQY